MRHLWAPKAFLMCRAKLEPGTSLEGNALVAGSAPLAGALSFSREVMSQVQTKGLGAPQAGGPSLAASHLQAWQELPGNPFLPACPILLFRARAEGQSTERAHRAWKEALFRKHVAHPVLPCPFPAVPPN